MFLLHFTMVILERNGISSLLNLRKYIMDLYNEWSVNMFVVYYLEGQYLLSFSVMFLRMIFI